MSSAKVNLNQIQHLMISKGKNKKTKKTSSLYDTPLVDRTYWGNDKGSELLLHLGRNAIRKSMKYGILFDIDYDDLTRVLNKKYKDELIQFQLDLMKDMIIDREVVIVKTNDYKWQIQWLI